MNLYDIRKIAKLNHFRELKSDEFITDLGLYDSVLIDTENIHVYDQPFVDEVPYVESSQDVEALHSFAYLNSPVMLPCPYCGRLQAFKSNGLRNPKRIQENVVKTANKRKSVRMFPLSASGIMAHSLNDENDGDKETLYNEELMYTDLIGRIKYSFVENKIYMDPNNVFDQTLDFNRIRDGIARKVISGIIENVDDLRKDFVCSYDESHHLFVEFALYLAIDEIPEEIIECQERLAANPNTIMEDDEKEALQLYENLRYCIIAKKVAQYPSMADMQFFDKVKYKPVLKNQYTDYTMALGLYASGVGVGAFVYLRRIMEGIVEEFHQECISQSDWNEEEYKKRRFDEKIQYIESFGKIVIPNDIAGVKNKLYGVLSHGIHTASDEECKNLFPYMKFAIETFLDKKVGDKEREKRIQEMNREIANAALNKK